MEYAFVKLGLDGSLEMGSDLQILFYFALIHIVFDAST